MEKQIIDPKELNYPDAIGWMWNYCVYLGPWESVKNKYDLGVYIDPDGNVSEATVYGNRDGEYISGGLVFEGKTECWVLNNKRRTEILRRLKELNHKEEAKNGKATRRN